MQQLLLRDSNSSELDIPPRRYSIRYTNDRMEVHFILPSWYVEIEQTNIHPERFQGNDPCQDPPTGMNRVPHYSAETRTSRMVYD
jgi:hypothetical protein